MNAFAGIFNTTASFICGTIFVQQYTKYIYNIQHTYYYMRMRVCNVYRGVGTIIIIIITCFSSIVFYAFFVSSSSALILYNRSLSVF